MVALPIDDGLKPPEQVLMGFLRNFTEFLRFDASP
jgi:hypothetical protein